VAERRQHRLGERDLRVLAFAAEHRLVLAEQAAALLGVSGPTAAARLRVLTEAGYLRRQQPMAGPSSYLIDRSGLRAVGSPLPRPHDVDPGLYRHDVGVAWLWLAAHSGGFGRVAEVVSERQMRSHDGRPEGRTEPLGVRMYGVGPHGGERRHYPDLLVETATGHRVAIELELTGKGSGARERILSGYGADPRIDAVLYLVERDRVGQAIARSAERLGLGAMIKVQRVAFDRDPGGQPAERSADRAPRQALIGAGLAL
jgi:hypothetical protein